MIGWINKDLPHIGWYYKMYQLWMLLLMSWCAFSSTVWNAIEIAFEALWFSNFLSVDNQYSSPLLIFDVEHLEGDHKSIYSSIRSITQ